MVTTVLASALLVFVLTLMWVTTQRMHAQRLHEANRQHSSLRNAAIRAAMAIPLGDGQTLTLPMDPDRQVKLTRRGDDWDFQIVKAPVLPANSPDLSPKENE